MFPWGCHGPGRNSNDYLQLPQWFLFEWRCGIVDSGPILRSFSSSVLSIKQVEWKSIFQNILIRPTSQFTFESDGTELLSERIDWSMEVNSIRQRCSGPCINDPSRVMKIVSDSSFYLFIFYRLERGIIEAFSREMIIVLYSR